MKYELEQYQSNRKTKHTCPKCGHKNRFRMYIDTTTGGYVGDKYGWCDRVNNCGYHEKPWNSFDYYTRYHKPILRKPPKRNQPPKKYLDKSEYIKKLVTTSDNNRFATFLWIQLGVKNGDKIIKDYKLGTGKNYSCLFPYFDENFNLVTYKEIQYQTNGKRIKGKSWYDSNPNKYKPFPLFGLDRINDFKHKPIGIVEGEKTACLMSFYNPYILWLATGGKGMLHVDKIEPIKDREIYLYPDVGAFGSWHDKMLEIQNKYPRINIDMSKECEIWHEQGFISNGDDVADYYLNTVKYSHKFQRIMPKEYIINQ